MVDTTLGCAISHTAWLSGHPLVGTPEWVKIPQAGGTPKWVVTRLGVHSNAWIGIKNCLVYASHIDFFS